MQPQVQSFREINHVVIDRLDVFVFRAPADPPVQTSFGIMHDRPAVLIRIRDADGVEGWGEIWCNFPTVGAEHRARLALTYGRAMVEGKTWKQPQDAWNHMQKCLYVLMLQTGESGPLHQMMAGIDTAMWDLFARRADMPLWKYLCSTSMPRVRVYASGINPSEPDVLALAKQKEGYRDFKLKVGFGAERDLHNLHCLREALGKEARLMTDANQAWSLEEAITLAQDWAELGVLWLEEPLRADAPPHHWVRLTQELGIPLAGGENLRGDKQFSAFIDSGGMAVIQPDVGKWGGVSGCLRVARHAVRAGRWYCPHWLGAGIGLAASLHLKAAVGGPGYVEVDANTNPLRDLLAQPIFHVTAGVVELNESPGLGVLPDLNTAQRYLVEIENI